MHMKDATTQKRREPKSSGSPQSSAALHRSPTRDDLPRPGHRDRPMGVERNVHGRSDDAEAFLHDPQGGPARTNDALAESMAEEFLSSATSGEEVGEDVRDELLTEELGGPFSEARPSQEFGQSVDEMNPLDATKEPFPTAMRSPSK